MPTNRKERAAERRRQEAETNKTLIIPQITPELLEQRRREADDAGRRQAARYQPAPPPPPQPPAPPPERAVHQPTTRATSRLSRVRQETPPPPPAPPERPETPPEAPPAPAPAPQPAPQEETPARPGRPTLAQAEAELAETVLHDHIWLNNPVFVRGLAMAAVVAAASDADNALMLSAATLLLLTATRVLAEAVCRLTRGRFRPLVYAYTAAVSYIPIYILLYNLFGAELAVLGIYLPLMVVDPAVVKRMEFDDEETLGHALRLGLNNSVGVCLALLLVGCLRELLAVGTVFGHPVVGYGVLPLAGQVAGGFLVAGVLAAGWTAVSSAYVRYKEEEVRRLYAKRKR